VSGYNYDASMDTIQNKLQWEALEYEDRERNKDWFIALGIIVATCSIASIIFGNYFFAALLIISGVLLALFALRAPRMIAYELNDLGLKIGSDLFLYERLKSFHVEVDRGPTLFVKSERLFMPVLNIPIHPDHASTIEEILIEKNIPQETMAEHPSERIMEFFGF